MPDLHTLARYAVFAAFSLSVLVAFASWLVRARRVSPFGALGRMLRAMSEPVIRPVEARLVRLGGNPVNAGWWLVVVVAVAGVVLLARLDWGVRTLYGRAAGASHRDRRPPRRCHQSQDRRRARRRRGQRGAGALPR